MDDHDRYVAEMIDKTSWLIQSTDYERLALFGETAIQSERRLVNSHGQEHGFDKDRRVWWEQHSRGHFEQIGTFGGAPLNVNIFWVTLHKKDGPVIIAFWDMISPVHHLTKTEEWLTKKFPHIAPDHMRNAMNFHQVSR